MGDAVQMGIVDAPLIDWEARRNQAAAAGERGHTEYSYKYCVEGFRALGSDVFETVINKSEKVKETKKTKGEDITPKEMARRAAAAMSAPPPQQGQQSQEQQSQKPSQGS